MNQLLQILALQPLTYSRQFLTDRIVWCRHSKFTEGKFAHYMHRNMYSTSGLISDLYRKLQQLLIATWWPQSVSVLMYERCMMYSNDVILGSDIHSASSITPNNLVCLDSYSNASFVSENVVIVLLFCCVLKPSICFMLCSYILQQFCQVHIYVDLSNQTDTVLTNQSIKLRYVCPPQNYCSQ